ERQGVVEDRDVRVACHRLGRRGGRRQQRGATEQGAPEQPGARAPVQRGERLFERTVAIDVGEGEVGHLMNPLPRRVFMTVSGDATGSAACGAGFWPVMSRIQAACRASTETISAAAASVPDVRLGACAL